MFYIIYRVTNKINGKVYIGCHKTTDLDDGYMGSGTYLKRSIKKHGIGNFEKRILFIYDNPDEMFAKEAELVDEDFLLESNTYNIKLGGNGGFDHINTPEKLKNRRSIRLKNSKKGGTIHQTRMDSDPEYREQTISRLRDSVIKAHKAGKYKYDTRSGSTQTDETKQKIGAANSMHQQGEGNSQFGTMWIWNPELKESKRIKKGDPMPEGWQKGRKMKCYSGE